MANGEQDAYQERHETDPISPASQAQAGATGGQPAPTSDSTSPSPSDQGQPQGQQDPSMMHKILHHVADTAHKAGQELGRLNHPYQSMFDVLSGGGTKLAGYAQEGDLHPETGKPMKAGEPINVKRGATEKWASILAGAIAGAAAGHGPAGLSHAAQAGVETGQKRVAGQQEQAKEQSAIRREEQNAKELRAHTHSEMVKNYMLANHMSTEERQKNIEFNKPLGDAWELTLKQGESVPTVAEYEMREYLKNHPESLTQHNIVPTGERQSIDPKTNKPILDDAGNPHMELTYKIFDPNKKFKPTQAMIDRWQQYGVKDAGRLSPDREIDPQTYLTYERQAQSTYGQRLQDAELQKKEADAAKKERETVKGIHVDLKRGNEVHTVLIDPTTGKEIRDLGVAAKPENPVAADLAAVRGQKMVRAMKEGKWHLLSAADAKAGGFTNITAASDKDFNDAQTHNVVMNDMQAKLNDVVNARGALDQHVAQRTIIANALAMGEKGTTWEQLSKAGVMAGATPQTQEYVQAVLSLRESGLGLPKEITGGSRVSEIQASALWATLPSGASLNSKYALGQAKKFQANIDRLRQRIPQIEGMNVESAHASLQEAKLPQGNGRLLDAATAQRFFNAAGGDAEKAKQLARQNGYKVK